MLYARVASAPNATPSVADGFLRFFPLAPRAVIADHVGQDPGQDPVCAGRRSESAGPEGSGFRLRDSCSRGGSTRSTPGCGNCGFPDVETARGASQPAGGLLQPLPPTNVAGPRKPVHGLPQQRLNLRPLPHTQGEFRPGRRPRAKGGSGKGNLSPGVSRASPRAMRSIRSR